MIHRINDGDQNHRYNEDNNVLTNIDLTVVEVPNFGCIAALIKPKYFPPT
jgi:hypothetical protein